MKDRIGRSKYVKNARENLMKKKSKLVRILNL